MSSRTTNLNLVKPSSDENVSLPVINGNYDTLDTEVAARVKTADIQNNLTSTATNKPLSAAQGKALSDTKVNISDIKDNLTSTDADKPLSAKQGKTLNDTIASHFVNNFMGNLNDATISGFYYFHSNNVLNAPSGTSPFSMIVMAYSSTYLVQIANRTNADMGVYKRTCNGGTWSAWQQLVVQDNLNGYYSAGTDRTVQQNRENAIRYLYNNHYQGTCVVRYLDGYYYTYLMPLSSGQSQSSILEIGHTGSPVCIWAISSSSITLLRTL